MNTNYIIAAFMFVVLLTFCIIKVINAVKGSPPTWERIFRHIHRLFKLLIAETKVDAVAPKLNVLIVVIFLLVGLILIFAGLFMRSVDWPLILFGFVSLLSAAYAAYLSINYCRDLV